MRELLTVFTIFFATAALACECEQPANSKDVKESFEWAELIVEGTFISNLTTGSDEQGTHVLFKVNSVLKGELTSELISIFQLNAGDCQRRFMKETQYIIYADQVLKLECQESESQTSNSELPPPEPKYLKNGILVTPECTTEYRTDYWNKLISERPSFLTDDCGTFLSNSEYGQLILKN